MLLLLLLGVWIGCWMDAASRWRRKDFREKDEQRTGDMLEDNVLALDKSSKLFTTLNGKDHTMREKHDNRKEGPYQRHQKRSNHTQKSRTDSRTIMEKHAFAVLCYAGLCYALLLIMLLDFGTFHQTVTMKLERQET